MGFPDGSDGKESACSAGDPGLIQVGKIPWKGMSTHFSILAWRIPWTEEPGVGHDGVTTTFTFFFFTRGAP